MIIDLAPQVVALKANRKKKRSTEKPFSLLLFSYFLLFTPILNFMYRFAFTHTLRFSLQPIPLAHSFNQPRTLIMTDFVAGALSKAGIKISAGSSNSYSSTTQGAGAAKDDESQNATEILTHNQYKTSGLEKDVLSPSALTQFRSWFQDAIDHPEIPEPEAMTISTVSLEEDQSGKKIARPSSRIVLLKRVDQRGFIFFTNYSSRKGNELERNPFIALTFYWHALHRSVRVCGKVEKLTKGENDQYFNSRPLGSRMGAIASPQSQKIEERSVLEQRVKDVEKQYNIPGAAGLDPEQQSDQYEDRHVPVPDYWGGYRVIADEVEFWMGRSNRLHDRFRYTRDLQSDKDEWQINRLAP